MFISNNCSSFHFWWNKNLVKHGKVSRYDETDCRYVVLFIRERNYVIFKRIRHLMSVKSSITYVFFRNYAKIKVNWFDSLPLEKSFHNARILINSVWNKYKNNCYCNIFLEKASNELPKKYFYIKYRCFIIIELTFLKELILIKQVDQKSLIFVTICNS